jgi:hypothetical protein
MVLQTETHSWRRRPGDPTRSPYRYGGPGRTGSDVFCEPAHPDLMRVTVVDGDKVE